jgi:hypothetical protein
MYRCLPAKLIADGRASQEWLILSSEDRTEEKFKLGKF